MGTTKFTPVMIEESKFLLNEYPKCSIQHIARLYDITSSCVSKRLKAHTDDLNIIRGHSRKHLNNEPPENNYKQWNAFIYSPKLGTEYESKLLHS